MLLIFHNLLGPNAFCYWLETLFRKKIYNKNIVRLGPSQSLRPKAWFGPNKNTKIGLHTTTHHRHPPPPPTAAAAALLPPPTLRSLNAVLHSAAAFALKGRTGATAGQYLISYVEMATDRYLGFRFEEVCTVNNVCRVCVCCMCAVYVLCACRVNTVCMLCLCDVPVRAATGGI